MPPWRCDEGRWLCSRRSTTDRARSPRPCPRRRPKRASSAPEPDRAAVVHLLVSTAFLVVAGVGLVADARGRPVPRHRGRPALLWAAPPDGLPPRRGRLAHHRRSSAGSTTCCPASRAAGSGARTWPTPERRIIALVTLVGTGPIALGFGDGSEPFGLPIWLDVPLIVALVLPAVVAIRTVATRTERHVFVSLWYVLGGVVWLPVLVFVGCLPGLSPFGHGPAGAVATWGLANAWVVGVGTGLGYYALVKSTGRPLASRRLAAAGFWSLMFAAGVGGAPPARVRARARLARRRRPAAHPGAPGGGAGHRHQLLPHHRRCLAARPDRTGGGRRAGGAVLSLVAGLMVATGRVPLGRHHPGLHRVLGRSAHDHPVRRPAGCSSPPGPTRRSPDDGAGAARGPRPEPHPPDDLGGGGHRGAAGLAGFAQGFAWSGGSFTGLFVDAGDGWTASAGLPGTLSGLAIFTGLVTFAGQFAFALTVYRTITSGRATSQEVIVPVASDE
jgi:hypothetical protein